MYVQKSRVVGLLAAAVGGLFFSAASLAAQDVVLVGRVLGPDQNPVAGQDVLLHRVTDAGGARLSQATTDGEGRFTLRAENAGSGVFFVATRYEGQLYIGPMLRPPFPENSEYVVQVGIPGVGDVASMMNGVGGAAAPTTTAPAAQSGSPGTRGAGFGVLLVALAIGTGAYLAVQGTGPSARRRALIRIAELDEQRGRGADAGARAQARTLLVRRVTEPLP